MRRVENKVALITGAGMGLGRAAAFLLASEGAKIAATDIDAAVGEATAEEIKARGGEAIFRYHDVADADDWSAVLAAIADRFGRLDVLVHNARIARANNSEETRIE